MSASAQPAPLHDHAGMPGEGATGRKVLNRASRRRLSKVLGVAGAAAVLALAVPGLASAAVQSGRPTGAKALVPGGKGYWLVSKDGGVFSFGGAPYYGSLPGDGVHVDDIVGIVPTPSGHGYWLVGSDGGIFSFGDAQYYGSLPGYHVQPAAPVVSGAAVPAAALSTSGAGGPQGTSSSVGPQGPAGAAGPAGPQGAQGAAGPQGAQGPAGPSDLVWNTAAGPVVSQGDAEKTVVSINLPAGNWQVLGSVLADNPSSPTAVSPDCSIFAPASTISTGIVPQAQATLPSQSLLTLSVQAVVAFSSPATVTLQCADGTNNLTPYTYLNASLQATSATTVTQG